MITGGPEIWVRDVLNLGISPRVLLDLVREKVSRGSYSMLANAVVFD
jgi:hypothetical protein